MRVFLASGVGASILATAACAATTVEPVELRFAPTNLQGQSLVARLVSIDLDVYAEESGVACTELGGASGTDADPAPSVLLSAELGSANCPAGARFCGSVELERSKSPRVFVARGKDDTGAVFAQACVSASLDKAQVDVELVFQRALPTPVCGNDVLEAPETCEGDITSSCNNACVSTEVVVSIGGTGNQTVNDQGTKKTAPALVAAADSIVAIYTDSTSASDAGDVAMRVTTPTLDARTSPSVLRTSFFLPSAAAPGAAAPGTQQSPAACAAGESLLVAFETDGVGVDIALHALTASTFASGAEQLLSGAAATGNAGDQRFPAVACTDAGGLVVWRDVTSGRVQGRSVTLPDTLGRIQELGGASEGNKVAVARRNGGFIAAWESGRQIRYRVMGQDGTPSGGERTLGGDALRAAPALATLADGRVALAFVEGEGAARGVRLQRFDADGRLVGDPVKVSEGDGAESPAVIATAAAGGAYGVVWLAGDQVRARYLGGTSGLLLSPLTGTEDIFAASLVEGRTRTSPTAALVGTVMAVAWQDVAADGGIVVRLLPIPER